MGATPASAAGKGALIQTNGRLCRALHFDRESASKGLLTWYS